ncbi:MAG: AAA family ATPase [Deltaproteobacteria bacterium]
MIALRDLVVHGERIAPEHLRSAFDVLSRVLQRFAWLAEYRLVVRTGAGGFALEGEVPMPMEVLDGSLPEHEPCLMRRDGTWKPLSLSPLLRFRPGASKVLVDELFFVNAAVLERLQYVGFRFAESTDGKSLGSYEAFRNLMKQIPTPEIPKDPRLDFAQLARESTRFFVGREGVLEDVDSLVRSRAVPYIVVRALPGMGKTALLARLLRRSPPRRAGETGPGDRWVYHFCGNIDGRNSPTVMIRSLLAQVSDAVGLVGEVCTQALRSTDLKELRDTHLPALLHAASQKLGPDERLVLVIDALDEGFGGEDPMGSVLPRMLPENVVAIVSWRVDADGRNKRVEESLRHLAENAMREVPGADPLRGLTRDNVREFAATVRASVTNDRAAAPVPESVLDALWSAGVTPTGAADPFYLRFVAQGAEAGAVDLDRPETIPASLDDAFEDAWMGLPTERGFALHRMLVWLAVLREHGTDALLAELLERELKTPFTADEVGALRVQAGKLLVYDGDRYTLFHDRFRRFLVGEQKDPLDLDTMGA